MPCTGVGEMAALCIQTPLQEEYVPDVACVCTDKRNYKWLCGPVSL